MTTKDIVKVALSWSKPLVSSIRDLLPITLVVGVFQAMVFRQPLEDSSALMLGVLLVVVGLTLFVVGLQASLFPIGEQMAHDFARKGSAAWLMAFAFALGFGTTFAEPALIAVAAEAAQLTAADMAEQGHESQPDRFAFTLRATVAVSVGCALVLGVLRIIQGWPLHYLIMSGYALVIVLTPFAPQSIVAVAYDSGGVTTSTITVPLTAALGVGLASSIQGRNPLIDGFGLIAFASLMPIIFVLVLGMIWS